VFSQVPAIALGSVLCTAIGMMDAAGRLLSRLNRGLQSRQGKSSIDLSAERITITRDQASRICEVDEAGRDTNVRDVADPAGCGKISKTHHFAFWVDDLRERVEKLKAARVPILVPPVETDTAAYGEPPGKKVLTTLFQDPNGIIVQFDQRLP
jgi:archaellin